MIKKFSTEFKKQLVDYALSNAHLYQKSLTFPPFIES
jgi:hypothetical protein